MNGSSKNERSWAKMDGHSYENEQSRVKKIGRSRSMKVDGPKVWKWKVSKYESLNKMVHEFESERPRSPRSMKVDGSKLLYLSFKNVRKCMVLKIAKTVFILIHLNTQLKR